jgi:hypothetical protein
MNLSTSQQKFYFTIPEANVFEVVKAASFTEAKQIAAQSYMPFWNQIQWLEPSQKQ